LPPLFASWPPFLGHAFLPSLCYRKRGEPSVRKLFLPRYCARLLSAYFRRFQTFFWPLFVTGPYSPPWSMNPFFGCHVNTTMGGSFPLYSNLHAVFFASLLPDRRSFSLLASLHPIPFCNPQTYLKQDFAAPRYIKTCNRNTASFLH